MLAPVMDDTTGAWSLTDENLAMLIDRLDYWLTSEYAQWTTDPDDPEVKAARAERKRRGHKPPPVPIISPVAHRPPSKHQELAKRAQELRDYYNGSTAKQPGESTFDALDRLLGDSSD